MGCCYSVSKAEHQIQLLEQIDTNHTLHLSKDLQPNTYVIACYYDSYINTGICCKHIVNIPHKQRYRIENYMNDVKNAIDDSKCSNLIFKNKTLRQITVGMEGLGDEDTRFATKDPNKYDSLILILCGDGIKPIQKDSTNYTIFDYQRNKMNVNDILKPLKLFWNIDKIRIYVYGHCVLNIKWHKKTLKSSIGIKPPPVRENTSNRIARIIDTINESDSDDDEKDNSSQKPAPSKPKPPQVKSTTEYTLVKD